MRASQSDLAGLTMAKRDLEASVNAERDACIILRGELQESKEALGKLRHEVGTLDAELKHQVWLCQGREEEVLRLPKLNVDLSAQLREAQKHCEDLVAAAQCEYFGVHPPLCICCCLLFRLRLFCASCSANPGYPQRRF